MNGTDKAAADGRRSSLRAFIPALILIVMFAAMAGVGTFAYRKIRADVLELSDGLFTAVSMRIESEVRRYFTPASELVSLVAGISQDGEFRAAPGTVTEQVGVGIVSRYPQISAFLIADELGNFVMPQSKPDGAVYTRYVERTETGGMGRWIFRDLEGRVTHESKPESDTFDPRERSWFEGADLEQGLYWSDVYTFYSTQQPGLTAATPVVDEVGITLGVLGVDIQLSTLSEFLGRLDISANGTAIIVDDAGQVIAHPSMEKTVIADGQEARIARVPDLEDAILERAFNRFQIESHGLRTISVEDTRYVTVAVSLLGSVGHPWTILLVAPEDDFAGFVERNFQVLLLLAGSIVALGAALAALLMVQGRRADQNARMVRAGQAELDAQAGAFGEIARLVETAKGGDSSANAKLTEIVAGATGASRMSIWRLDDDQVLRCLDCFESATHGHTGGTELHRSEVESLVAALQADGEVAVENTALDERTEALHRLYLDAMGCHALLAVPIRIDTLIHGLLMLEDQSEQRTWSTRQISFLHTVATMIETRMRDAAFVASVRGSAPSARDGETRPEEPGTPSRPPAPFEAMRSADVGEIRTNRFEQAIAESGLRGAATTTDLFRTATVAVLWLDDPIRLAGKPADSAGKSAVDAVVRRLQDLADREHIHYMKVSGDEIVFAGGLNGDPADGARAVMAMTLGLRDCCDDLLGAATNRLVFQVGVDTGPVMGTTVGRNGEAYVLWGEASRGARLLAESGIQGSVQVSQTTYELLREEFLFRARGRFFTREMGETGTYVLADRI